MAIQPTPLQSCLVVGLDSDGFRAVSRELSNLNLRFQSAESAEVALDDGSFSPDLLIVNLQLPGASGLELIASLRDRGTLPQTVLLAESPTSA